jgi:carboxymethylenebutenolidase
LNELIKITGGLERDDLARFYKYHFIDLNPPDMKLMHVSRTAGMDRIVDEMVVLFTHTTQIAPVMLIQGNR